jgi:DNA primase
MSTWIDFKALRAKLDFEEVLKFFKVEVKRKKGQHMGFCPLPKHNGNRNSPSFSANLEKGIFQCFGCGAKGNILEFSALMSDVDPQDGSALRKVASILQDRFCPENRGKPQEAKSKSGPKVKSAEVAPAKAQLPVIVNEPLNFELQGLDAKHPYLAERGLTAETIRHFGLGFCSRGYFKDRVVMPLRSEEGHLIGYGGRITDDKMIGEKCPKYLFPGSRERDGKNLEFRKSEFLYNGHTLKETVGDLIVVEGFMSVFWLFQCGILPVVALMGWACSEQQANLIVSHVKGAGVVWILSDGDAAGERCATNIFQLVATQRAVRWLKLREGKQPTDISNEELRRMLGW